MKITDEKLLEFAKIFDEYFSQELVDGFVDTAIKHYNKLAKDGLHGDKLIVKLIGDMAGDTFKRSVLMSLQLAIRIDDIFKEPDKPLNPRDFLKRVK